MISCLLFFQLYRILLAQYLLFLVKCIKNNTLSYFFFFYFYVILFIDYSLIWANSFLASTNTPKKIQGVGDTGGYYLQQRLSFIFLLTCSIFKFNFRRCLLHFFALPFRHTSVRYLSYTPLPAGYNLLLRPGKRDYHTVTGHRGSIHSSPAGHFLQYAFKQIVCFLYICIDFSVLK